MRRRIQQLARGKFEQARPFLLLQTEKVDIEVLEGKDYTGDFVITSANHVPMRGVIYSSNPRMECLTPQFEGEEVRIRYQFHSYGLVEGDIQKGEFCIVCNQGEYNLSFVVSISKLYAETTAGTIKNLNDFAKLAQSSVDEAYRLFYSQNFRNILHPSETREALLYEGLSSGAPSRQKVEEFLVSIHKKNRVELALPKEEMQYEAVENSFKETFEIQRSQWGVLDIRIESDAQFLGLEKKHLTEENFMGSVCVVEYYVDITKMHAGRNYGRIYMDVPGRTLCFTVCASTRKADKSRVSDHTDQNNCRIRLLELYLDYRLKRIVTGMWANESAELLDHLMVLVPDFAIYRLMKAQVLIINKQRQEASWIMEDFKRECSDHTSEEWGYYLYLCTLVEREPTYVDKVTEEIKQIFYRHQDSPLLFWILLFTEEEYYRNNARRWKAIEEWVEHDKSPFFYLEAYYLIWQDPYLLNRLDRFEIEVLNWARKQGVLTKDIAAQVINMIPEKKEFNRFVYLILEDCYHIDPSESMLAAICGYLIKSQRFEHAYHEWYKLGIEHEIRITSLYEAYLMSMDGHTIADVPRMIQMYFQYDSGLSYQQKAVLFVNIIAAKDRQPEVYQKYRRTMEQFAMEQMEAGHINDNLAVIYDEMIQLGVLNEELAHRMAGILFTHKLSCLDGKIVQAYIYQRQLKNPQVVPFSNGTAYFSACTSDYCIVLEDAFGNRFCESIGYQDEALMNPDLYMERCLALAGQELSFAIYQLHDKKDFTAFNENDSRCFSMALHSEKISDAYKAFLQPQVIRYYQRQVYDGVLSKYLLDIDYGILHAEDRRFLMDLLVEEHLYEKAYLFTQMYGYDYMRSTSRVALCSYAITNAGFEEDDFLLGFAEATFGGGKYNDVILIYLCKYYNGATKVMAELWKEAGTFQIDTFDLEERIITQMLYSTDYVPYTEQIYESYYEGGGRELICMAYLSYFAHEYLVKDTVVPEHVFSQLQKRCAEDQELNDACRLGLLKYFSEKRDLTGEQRTMADRLMGGYISQNIYFAFYRKFEKKLLLKYHLYDKFFVEYHAASQEKVQIRYSLNGGQYREEELREMYGGIFVKEFILFFGEMVQYYIIEEKASGEKVTESSCLSNKNTLEESGRSRYERINELLMHVTLGEEEQIKKDLKNYYGMKKVTEEVFDLL